MLGAALEVQDLVEEIGVAEVFLGGLLQEGGELGRHPMEPQLLAVVREAFQLRRGHAAAPSSAKAA